MKISETMLDAEVREHCPRERIMPSRSHSTTHTAAMGTKRTGHDTVVSPLICSRAR